MKSMVGQILYELLIVTIERGGIHIEVETKKDFLEVKGLGFGQYSWKFMDVIEEALKSV